MAQDHLHSKQIHHDNKHQKNLVLNKFLHEWQVRESPFKLESLESQKLTYCATEAYFSTIYYQSLMNLVSLEMELKKKSDHFD